MKLFLYDFDGTLVKKDSMISFLYFININSKAIFFLNFVKAAPSFFLYFFKIITRDQLKENFLNVFFKNILKKELDCHAKKFAFNIVSQIEPTIFNQLKHDPDNSTHCIVTASLDIWMEPISNLLDVELIATKSMFNSSNCFIGINGKNCNNSEKVARIKRNYDLKKFNEISVYGNSSGDKAMIELGDKQYQNYFF